MPMIYDDLYLRDALGETGEYPSRSATLCMSPDIIAWGTEPLPDANIYLAQNYDKTWYRNPVRGQHNYIYVRAKNLFPGRQTGKVHLYYAVGGATQDIAAWRRNVVGTGIPGQDYVMMDAARNEVVSGDTSFIWNPPSSEGQAHYCFIAQLVTEEHPNPLPDSFPTPESYVKWVADNPAVAWRNIDVINASSPPSYQGDFVMTNVAATEREFLFILEGTNLPKDTLMQMSCAASGPEPPVDVSGEATGKLNSQITASSHLPANYSASFTATVTLPAGQQWGPTMSVRIEQFVITKNSDGDFLHSMALPIREIVQHDVNGASVREGMAVRMGTYTVTTEQQA